MAGILKKTDETPRLNSPSVLLLIAVNLIPLFGALFLGWDVGAIMLLYWMETVVIGLLNVPKIITARKPIADGSGTTPQQAGGCGLIFMAVFFMVHYGGFNLGHFMFLKDMFDLPPINQEFAIALAGIAGSHLFSLIRNWFGKREFEKVSPNLQMFRPYGRVVVMHVVIILGGFFALMTGGGIVVLILLIGLKTIVDVYSHRWGHTFVQQMNDAEDGRLG